MDTKIKVLITALLFLMACSGGSGDPDGGTGMAEMTLGVTETGTIASVGEVDTYSLRVAETNRFLSISCDETSSGSGVDLMVTVFEEDEDGNLTRLFGKHKPMNATPPANIDMALYIDTPKDLVITVRDVMDNDASSTVSYRLVCNYTEGGEGNHDFSNAESLTIGTSATFFDAIEEVGEVDCFTFSPDRAGVYSVTVTPNSEYLSTNIQLASALYDADGNRIQTVTEPDDTMLSLLDPADGPFYITVHDRDDSDMDAAAVYGVTVAPVDATETMVNDSSDTATMLSESGGTFTADGEIEYASASLAAGYGEDMDWYTFDLADPAPDTYQAVDITISGSSSANASLILRVEVYDADLDIVMSRDFSCGGDDYRNRFRAGSGPYYLSVSPLNPEKLDQGAEYQVLLQPGDLTDDDDNTANDAISLTSDVPETGSIGYQADVDWYSLTVDTSSPRIVGVELASDTSVVDYQLSIWRGTELVKQVSDLDGTDGDTHLKTSVYVPEDIIGTADYYFKVGDAQNNEGSDVAYTITATETTVPTSVATIAQVGSDTLRYHGEIDEQNETGGDFTEVELEVFSGYQPTFSANTDWLDFKAAVLPDGIDLTEPGDGTTVIDFPWISGYIDYQGDRDMFQIDLDKLSDAGAETAWYYDIEVRMVVPSPGSEVEYVWKFYRDRNLNGVVMDDPTSPDGYKACAGDTTPDIVESMDLTVPTGDDIFWVGNDWGENAKFYFGISDFNYQVLPDSEEENPDPDEDWGYDAPYYFKLQMIYHPGVSEPE